MACDTKDGTTCLTTILSTGITTAPIVTTIESILTTTKQIVTTCQATPGQTLTITPPPPPWYIDPSSTTVPSVPTSATTVPNIAPSYTTSTLLTSSTTTVQEPTITVTEIVVVLEGTSKSIYSTSTITLPLTTETLTSQLSPVPVVVVIGEHHGQGWHSWSDAQKGGLIAGCIIVLLVIALAVICCCCRARTRNTWIAQDWNHHRGHPPTVMSQPGYGGSNANRAI